MGSVTDDQRIAAAESYIDALVSHRADDVPFAADCVRIENGVKTGFSGRHLRRSLNRGPQYRIIAAVTDRSFTVEGEYVYAAFTIITKVRLGRRRVIAAVREKMLIPPSDGLIHHLKVTFKPRLRDAR
ncbi:MAG TPA: hypothetical protein VJL80_05345 [Aeromicrobium sp.]|nr:hypothetical protein [Aeromicrobium sp.]HKY57444.1 hypothetical protein [Aeromicrobium sp.]